MDEKADRARRIEVKQHGDVNYSLLFDKNHEGQLLLGIDHLDELQ